MTDTHDRTADLRHQPGVCNPPCPVHICAEMTKAGMCQHGTGQQPGVCPECRSMMVACAIGEFDNWTECRECAHEWGRHRRTGQQPAQPESGEARRWNIDRDGDDLLICFDDHDKGEKCEYEENVKPARSGCFYTGREIRHVMDRWPVATARTIAAELHRSVFGIRDIAAKLGVKRTAKQKSALYRTFAGRRKKGA